MIDQSRKQATVLAFDFGASSGRGIRAVYSDKRLSLFEVHRFENTPVEENGHLCLDFDTLLGEVKQALSLAGEVDSIGFDTWGVDFGLLDREGRLLGKPVHYRDARTDGIVPKALSRMSADALYAATGNQIMAINTLFQLLCVQEQQPELWQKAHTMLLMPDLFGYALCGEMACERTIASTTQLFDPTQRAWSEAVMDTFSIPQSRMAPLVSSGHVLGRCGNAAVISVAGHDTQCAVAAIPCNETEVAFLSCGTWSLLGCELEAPILTPESRAACLSNELGANGRINYLKNIIGLWLIQESRRQWRREGQDYSYAQLEQLALEAEPFACFIDPDDPQLTPPGDLPGRIREICRLSGQPIPESVGSVMRCIYESLALKYCLALRQLQTLTGKQFTALHLLGGGAKDRLLCQMTADSLGIPVIAGPVEATAIGNVLIQLVALGALPDIAAGRELVQTMGLTATYMPKSTSEWSRAFAIYRRYVK